MPCVVCPTVRVVVVVVVSLAAVALGCSAPGAIEDERSGVDDTPPTGGGPYPAPGDWPQNSGPGVPAVSFATDQLYRNCAYLDADDRDPDHHNLVVMYDGWLLMPWAPESGIGGIALFDISDPCAPVRAGGGFSLEMRESHSIGFSRAGGAWAVTDGIRLGPPNVAASAGILFWDLSDPLAPEPVKLMELPGARYPDAYDRVTLSVFWQVPYVYVGGGDNGVYVIDASDPRRPELVDQIRFEPVMRVGQVQAIGNLLVVTTAEQPRTVLLDISDPRDPRPIGGGDFTVRESPDGATRDAYFTNTSNGYVFYARKENGGGIIVYDIRDPGAPAWAGAVSSGGNGGYVFLKDNFAFVGESSFASIYDISDLGAITPVAELDLAGDLDTLVPVGNLAVLSVDDDADPDRGSAVAPWRSEPDREPPEVTWMWPADGATIGVVSSFGLTLSEAVDVNSAWEGSVRLYPSGTDPAETRVNGHVSAQENIVNLVPRAPLLPDTEYTLELPAGGLSDVSGNPLAEPVIATFRTEPR